MLRPQVQLSTAIQLTTNINSPKHFSIMRTSTTTLALFLGVTASVDACIRVHARHFQAPWPEKDSLSIELWDNNEVYLRCPSCVWDSYSDQDCKVQCGKYTVELGNYGRGGRITNNNNGYTATLQPRKIEKPSN